MHGELMGLFADMFAGRNLAPILTPQEFAARPERPRWLRCKLRRQNRGQSLRSAG